MKTLDKCRIHSSSRKAYNFAPTSEAEFNALMDIEEADWLPVGSKLGVCYG